MIQDPIVISVIFLWVIPWFIILMANYVYMLSGCTGGFITSELVCTYPYYEKLGFLHLFLLFGSVYVYFTAIPFLILFIIGIVIVLNKYRKL